MLNSTQNQKLKNVNVREKSTLGKDKHLVVVTQRSQSVTLDIVNRKGVRISTVIFSLQIGVII